MICANCNNEVLPGGKFCRKCGLPLPFSSGDLSENSDDVVTRELVTSMAKPAGLTSGSLDKVPQTDRITNDLMSRPEVSVQTNTPSEKLSSGTTIRKKIGVVLIGVALLSMLGLGYLGLKQSMAHREALGATLASEEVSSFLADYKSKEPHAMARHIMSSRPIAEDAITQVSKLLTSGGLELVDYNIVKADQAGSDVTVQISGTVKLNGNSQKFNDSVMVHGDSGRWRILPPTLDQVSEQGSPSYMVGSFLETILLAKLEQPAASQPTTKQKQGTEKTPAQPPAASTKQPADPKPATKPAEPAPRPEAERRPPPDGQPPSRPGGPGGTTIPIQPRPGGPFDGRPGGPMGMGYSRLQVVSIPPPKYTDAAKANKVQGNVIVIATFKADGTVGSPQVVRGLGYGLDEAALDVVKHIKFSPERVDGRPVDVTRTMRVPFVLPNS